MKKRFKIVKRTQKEGENMLAIKKKEEVRNKEIDYTVADNKDVLAAILACNQKHEKMMKKLAK
ncbi:MAG TPA: hypothetical protein VHR47_05540 [Bacillota bacterium]|nr:hypothetical protein [Bacillota bacterium]